MPPILPFHSAINVAFGFAFLVALSGRAVSAPLCITPEVAEETIAKYRKELQTRYLDTASVCNGRLTLTSGTAITTSDVTGATTIYFTPHQGSKVSLYNGTNWQLYSFSELSLALGTLTASRNYDVFVYSNSGTPTLELSAAWNLDGVTRTDELTLQDGIYVKSGSTGRRYLGTFYTTSTTTTEDSRARRLVWNMYWQVPRLLVGNIATASWSWGLTNSWRASAGNTTDGQGRVAFVLGLAGEFYAAVYQLADAKASQTPVPGIGLDNTVTISTARDQPSATSWRHYVTSSATGAAVAGYHFLQSIETTLGSGTGPDFYGSGAGAYFHALLGRIRG